MIAAHSRMYSTRHRSMMMMVTKKKKGGAAAAAAPAVAVLVLLLTAAAARADVSCADVDASLRPCAGYVTGKEAAPPGECCAGVKRVRAMATASGTAGRRQACECIKQAAARYQPLDAGAIRDLPAQCGETLPFPITLNFDCNTIP